MMGFGSPVHIRPEFLCFANFSTSTVALLRDPCRYDSVGQQGP